jgi:hypothetical protein
VGTGVERYVTFTYLQQIIMLSKYLYDASLKELGDENLVVSCGGIMDDDIIVV